jgi:hypothetical protein
VGIGHGPNVQTPHASSIKDLHNPGVLAAATRTFSRNHRRTRLRQKIQQISQQRKWLIVAPAPPWNESLLTVLASVFSPSCRQQDLATNAAALLLALAAAMPSTIPDLLNAPRSLKEARGGPDPWTPTNRAEYTTPSYAATIPSS